MVHLPNTAFTTRYGLGMVCLGLPGVVACLLLSAMLAGCAGGLVECSRADLAARLKDGDIETAKEAYGELLDGEATEDTFWLVVTGSQRFGLRSDIGEWACRWTGPMSFLRREANSGHPTARLLARMCLQISPEHTNFVYAETFLGIEPVWSSVFPMPEAVLLPVEEQMAILLTPVEFTEGVAPVTIAEAVKHIEKKTGMAVSIVPAEDFQKKSTIRLRSVAQPLGDGPRPILDVLLAIGTHMSPPGMVGNYHAIVMTKERIVLIRRNNQ